ncbi:signal peptide peptidase SppA [Lishizhenia sp.]|uniref:signal peptide peptidase SppA n=1 Tax=Lishizhenia sp. TaxID=2497594 RepID=UPI00299DA660|nr:signal peptide peptidase SppA [Lishizhenia sp.]MDX1445916.1 signal peptide peptidase SppA [Lishizhenia sp.]
MSNKVSFGRVFWPSFLALIIVIGGIFGIISLVISAAIPDVKYGVPSKTVLHLELKGTVVENSSRKLSPYDFKVENRIGLSDILYGLENAKTDDRVKGVYIDLKGVRCGLASAEEIRKALQDFQSSGKFLVTYFNGEVVGLKDFYIGSVAEEKYAFSSTMMEFGGMGMELMYFKGMLDKIGVEMQVIRGSNNDFKSAVEPYFLTEMSDSARLQNQVLLDNVWENYRSTIADDVRKNAEELNTIAEQYQVKRMDDAFKLGMVDSILYEDEVLNKLVEKSGAASLKKLKLKNFAEYARNKFYDDQSTARAKKANVAVVVAQGEITKTGSQLSSDKYVKLLREARLDKHIKTIVFRVNSPGGSALASDEIWREVKLANQEKSVIVSMGDLAASGGYYISAPAKRIFASSNTITGSIGVFGVIPYTGKALEDNLGLSFDRVTTNKHAVLTINQRLTDEEMNLIQQEVNTTYQQFMERVAEGRSLTVDQVNTIARGRVWTGTDALRVGLIDELGGLKEAIAYAVEDAGIEDPIIEYFPARKVNPIDAYLEILSEEQQESIQMQALPQELLAHFNKLKAIENHVGIQARIPEIVLN